MDNKKTNYLSMEKTSKSPILRIMEAKIVTPNKLLDVINYCTSEQQTFHPNTLAGLINRTSPQMNHKELKQASTYFERYHWNPQVRSEYLRAQKVIKDARTQIYL